LGAYLFNLHYFIVLDEFGIEDHFSSLVEFIHFHVDKTLEQVVLPALVLFFQIQREDL